MDRKTIKVLCVDDNFLVAEGIRLKLQLEPGFEWVGHLPDANHLSEKARELKPHIVLLDLDMPGKDAFTALVEVCALDFEVRVIIISGHVRGDLIDRAVECGAWGYISKGESTDAIVAAIRRVMDGEFALAPHTTMTAPNPTPGSQN